jgi:hypothetical protein
LQIGTMRRCGSHGEKDTEVTPQALFMASREITFMLEEVLAYEAQDFHVNDSGTARQRRASNSDAKASITFPQKRRHIFDNGRSVGSAMTTPFMSGVQVLLESSPLRLSADGGSSAASDLR